MDNAQKLKAMKYHNEEKKNFKEMSLFKRSKIYKKANVRDANGEEEELPRRSDRLSKKPRLDYLK